MTPNTSKSPVRYWCITGGCGKSVRFTGANRIVEYRFKCERCGRTYTKKELDEWKHDSDDDPVEEDPPDDNHFGAYDD